MHITNVAHTYTHTHTQTNAHTQSEKFKIELEGNNHINELIDELSSMQRALSCEREEKQSEVAARERIAGEMRAMKTELDKSEAAIARKVSE